MQYIEVDRTLFFGQKKMNLHVIRETVQKVVTSYNRYQLIDFIPNMHEKRDVQVKAGNRCDSLHERNVFHWLIMDSDK